MREIRERDVEAFQAVVRLWTWYLRPPSIRDIATELKLTSTPTYARIRRLEKLGLLVRHASRIFPVGLPHHFEKVMAEYRKEELPDLLKTLE